MANKLELEYSQSLPVQDAFTQVTSFLNGLQQGTLRMNSDEPIRVEFPQEVDFEFKLKDKPQKGGKLEIRIEWEEVSSKKQYERGFQQEEERATASVS